MSAIVTNKSYKAAIILNAGTDASGKIISKRTSFPALRNTEEPDKVLAVSQLFENLAENPVYSIEETTVNILSE